MKIKPDSFVNITLLQSFFFQTVNLDVLKHFIFTLIIGSFHPNLSSFKNLRIVALLMKNIVHNKCFNYLWSTLESIFFIRFKINLSFLHLLLYFFLTFLFFKYIHLFLVVFFLFIVLLDILISTNKIDDTTEKIANIYYIRFTYHTKKSAFEISIFYLDISFQDLEFQN